MRASKFITAIVVAGFGFAISAVAVTAVTVVARSAVNVRTGPGVRYGRVDTLFSGEVVNATQCQRGWCYIRHSGQNGWVSGRYLMGAGGGSGSGSGGGSSAADAALAAMLGVLIGNALSPPAPALPYGPDTCKPGFVWRDAIPGDHVCVRPGRRAAAAHENAVAGARVNPTGPYGPNTCIVGYVWREAYVGDKVCVTPTRRRQVRNENIVGPRNRVRRP